MNLIPELLTTRVVDTILVQVNRRAAPWESFALFAVGDENLAMTTERSPMVRQRSVRRPRWVYAHPEGSSPSPLRQLSWHIPFELRFRPAVGEKGAS